MQYQREPPGGAAVSTRRQDKRWKSGPFHAGRIPLLHTPGATTLPLRSMPSARAICLESRTQPCHTGKPLPSPSENPTPISKAALSLCQHSVRSHLQLEVTRAISFLHKCFPTLPAGRRGRQKAPGANTAGGEGCPTGQGKRCQGNEIFPAMPRELPAPCQKGDREGLKSQCNL